MHTKQMQKNTGAERSEPYDAEDNWHGELSAQGEEGGVATLELPTAKTNLLRFLSLRANEFAITHVQP